MIADKTVWKVQQSILYLTFLSSEFIETFVAGYLSFLLKQYPQQI